MATGAVREVPPESEVFVNGLAVNQDEADEFDSQVHEPWGTDQTDPEQTKEARNEEKSFMEKIGVFDYVTEDQVLKGSGKRIITTR